MDKQQSILERFSLQGKTALVTGGGQGIGKAFCEALGEAGAAVAVVDMNAQLAEETAHSLSKKGISTLAVTADITDQRDREKMMNRVTDTWGELTIAVNNAGICFWENAETTSSGKWRTLMELNLDSVFFCAQEEAKVMFKKGYGKIINTASMSGHIINTPQKQSPYNTSKAAVIQLTKSLAAEWVDRGIRVNSISPGYTKTKLVEDLIATPEGKHMYNIWMTLIPMGRMADVTDLQGALLYLASEASDYMTGQDLIIDGGYCIW